LIDPRIISFFGGAAGRSGLKAEHVVEAKRAVAADQPVIAKEPASRVANQHISVNSCMGSRRRVKYVSIVPEPGT
jgi:hypothetical protein